VTGLQHVIDSLAPIAVQEALFNQTFITNVSISQLSYTLEIDNVTISKVAGPTIKVVQQAPDDQHLHIEIGGLNATVDLACKFKALHLLPLTATSVEVTNLTLGGTVNFTSIDDDKVHWQMGEVTNFHLDDFTLKTDGSVSQFLVNILKGIIRGGINTALSKTLPNAVDGAVVGLNQRVANEGPYDFDVNVGGDDYPLNLTMTEEPLMEHDLIKINFDGTFHEPANETAGSPPKAHDFFPDIALTHREQIWLHQDTFNTLLQDLDASYFPVLMGDVNNTYFAAAFPEVVEHYGEDVDFDFLFSISSRNEGEVVEFSMENGIELGPGDDLLLMMNMTV
jgi:hypothetical protein